MASQEKKTKIVTWYSILIARDKKIEVFPSGFIAVYFLPRKPIRDNPQLFLKSKKLFQSQFFLANFVEELVKSIRLL